MGISVTDFGAAQLDELTSDGLQKSCEAPTELCDSEIVRDQPAHGRFARTADPCFIRPWSAAKVNSISANPVSWAQC